MGDSDVECSLGNEIKLEHNEGLWRNKDKKSDSDTSEWIESNLDIGDFPGDELEYKGPVTDTELNTPVQLSISDLFIGWTTNFYKPELAELPKEHLNRIDDESLKATLLKIVSKRLSNLRGYLTSWFSIVDWWVTKIDIPNIDFISIIKFKESDISIWNLRSWICGWEEFRIVDLDVWWELFSAIEIPASIKALKWNQTYVWAYFEEFRYSPEFQNLFLDKRMYECIDDWWMILSKSYLKSKDWKIVNNKTLFDTVEKDNLLMSSFIRWFRIMWFYESLILSEIVYRWLWERFLSVEISDEFDISEVVDYILNKISDFLSIDFRGFVDPDLVEKFTENEIISDWEWLPIKSMWLYISNDSCLSWFIFWLLYEWSIINLSLWPNYNYSIFWNDLSIRLAI